MPLFSYTYIYVCVYVELWTLEVCYLKFHDIVFLKVYSVLNLIFLEVDIPSSGSSSAEHFFLLTFLTCIYHTHGRTHTYMCVHV